MDKHGNAAAPEELVWGPRARLGFIDLSTSIVMSAELGRALPAGVSALMTRIRLPRGEVSARALGEMVESPRLEEAAHELADGGAQVIVFGCTTGSLLGGPGFDQHLVGRLQQATGVAATTTSTAVLAAFHATGVKRLGVGTPYIDELNNLEAPFLKGGGFEVVTLQGLQIDDDATIARVPYAETRRLAHAVARDADAVFLSCANLPTLQILDELERELGCPVISSVAATIWHALHLAGVGADRAGSGSLLAGGYRSDDPLGATSSSRTAVTASSVESA